MDDGKSAAELKRLGYRRATVWVVDRANDDANNMWRESAKLAALADERDGSNNIGAWLLDEILKDDR